MRRTDLENAGFKVSVKRQESTTQDPDTVLSQDPAGGQHDKGSTVTLTVAKEPSSATVPDETGKQDTDAVSALQDAGFKVSITRQDTAESGRGRDRAHRRIPPAARPRRARP